MIKKYFKIKNISAVLWGDDSENIFIAVHGNMSNKEDKVIDILANQVIKLGYQVLIINNIMKWFSIDEESLKIKKTIETPIGQTLYWDYYCYVNENPIYKWNSPTSILYGLKDDLCESKTLFDFVEKFHCDIIIMEQGEHYFHTKEQLEFFKEWLKNKLYTVN